MYIYCAMDRLSVLLINHDSGLTVELHVVIHSVFIRAHT